MKWEKKKLCECTEYITDGDHQPAPKADKGVHFIKIKDIVNNQVSFDAQVYVPQEYYDNLPMERKPQKEDVLYTVVGSFGIPSYVQTDELFCFERNIALLHPNKDIEPRFLYYSLKNPAFYKGVEIVANGSAQKLIPLSKLKDLKISVPDKEAQRHIADILSAYDDLIENNQRQIKLLEEAAQRLYKEWFVDLRFPGHENTKIVDGVPEGWQWCKVRDVADINSSALPKNYKEDFIDYVDLGSVRCGHMETRTRYNLNEAPGRAKRCAKDGDIIWGMVRPNLKAYALVTNPKETDVFSTGFAVLSAKKVPYSYLYCAVTQEEFVGYLVNATNGAAYPAVKPVHFEVADILKPDDKVLEQFHSVADSIYRKKEALENQNHNLRESRDLILPKLMSGEVEV